MAQGPSAKPTSDAPAKGSIASSTSERPWRVLKTIFRQPEVEADAVDACVIGEVQPSSETFHVRIANLGPDADAAKLSWEVGRWTGFQPDRADLLARYQRGPRQTNEGTAVQVRGRELGIWIDSDRPRPQRGDLIPVCPAYWWLEPQRAPRPFEAANRELSFALDLKVPTAEREGKAEVYVCVYFLFGDRRSKQHFWFGASLFDLRGAERFPDTVHVDDWEGGTGRPILFTALRPGSVWLHPGPGSAHFAQRTFGDYRRFEFRVGPNELRTAIAAMKKRLPKSAEASDEPQDYQLLHFNANPEVYAPQGSRGRLGLAIRDLQIVLLER
jgi:hypothetical protein